MSKKINSIKDNLLQIKNKTITFLKSNLFKILLTLLVVFSIIVKHDEIYNIFSNGIKTLLQWFLNNDIYWLLFAIFTLIISITYNKIIQFAIIKHKKTYTWASQHFYRVARRSRHYQVLVASAISLSILMAHILFCLIVFQLLGRKPWEITSFWTLGTLLVSAPVAFVIWRFRDENQSKDINLKEFQKIAEWVSGMHFPDNHIEISTTQTKTTKPLKSDKLSAKKLEISTEEKTTETTKKPANTDLFSKRSGAESLQIAAIYNLLPFYRGDHGSSFEKPAVNLLKSAWAIMQQDLLQQLNQLEQDKTKTPEEIAEQQAHICQGLQNRANSPLGQAITRVWMACDHNKKLLIHRHPEIFAGLCLSGMDFSLAGLEIDILREKLFTGRDEQGKSFDYSGIQLQAANLPDNLKNGFNFSGSQLNNANFLRVDLSGAEFSGAELSGANLLQAKLRRVDLSGAHLWKAKLSGADLWRAKLSGAYLLEAKLRRAYLRGVNLSRATLSEADLSEADLSRAKLSGADLIRTDLSGANLSGVEFSGAYLPTANLSGANLSGAKFSGAHLTKADFSKAFMSDNQITDYDSFISNDIELSSTFMIIPSDVSAELQQALLQKNAIVAIKDDSEPSLTTIHCKNKQTNEEIKWEKVFTDIDLPQTQALNPDWEIEIIKETT